MTKSKKARFGLIAIAVAVFVLASLVSCTVAPAEKAPVVTGETAKSSPSVMIDPLVNASRAKISVYGVNFEPGETLRVGIPIRRIEGTPPVLTFLGLNGEGRSFQADEDGNFILKNNNAPKVPGVYSVRVYNKDLSEIRASTIVVVE